MKRKRTYKGKKTTPQNNTALVTEPETSHSRPPLRKPVLNERTEEIFSTFHTQDEDPRTSTIMRGRQADLVTQKSGHGRAEDYTNALSTIIASVIKEISKDAGGIVNLTRSLVDNSINNVQMAQPNVDMDFEENDSLPHQNLEYKQPELNAALAVIKKTMALDAADPFNRPVDPIALEIPDYFHVIKTPMDFGTICNNLENGLKYMNAAEVLKDVQYIWSNCEKYNKKGDHILELMKRVKTYFIKYWKAAGLHMEQTPVIGEPSSSRHNNRQSDYPLYPTANKFTHLHQNMAKPSSSRHNIGQRGFPLSPVANNFSHLHPDEPEPSSSRNNNRQKDYTFSPLANNFTQLHQNEAEPSSSRYNNRQNDYTVSPLASNFTRLHQHKASSNQVAQIRPGPRPALGPINMQASQPQQNFSQPLSSSEEDEEDEEDEEAEPDIASTNTPKKRQCRGPTRGIKLLKTLETVGVIKVVTNELGEPIGPEAIQLTSFLGLVARDGNLAPLTYPTWTKVPKENKDNMWQQVLTKFDIHPFCYKWVMKSIRSKWRNFKFYLKANHYDTHATDEERLADCDERVLPDQWSFLVSQWSSKEWQSISAKNKAKRAKKKFNHTSGTKSFARIREEEKAKRPDGQEPTQAELFILTRTRKDGQPVNEETAAVISQLRESGTEDDYNRVMGIEGKGSVSLYGSNAPSRADALRMVSQKNAEVAEMKERLKSVEQTCSQMASQMSAMVSMMASLQKAPPSESFPNAAAAIMVPVGTSNQAEPTSTSNHKASTKQTRGRKKRK